MENHKTIIIGHTECRIGRTSIANNPKDLLKAEKLLSQQMFNEWFKKSVKKKSTGAPFNVENHSISNSHSHGWVCVARNPTHEIGIDIQVLSNKCEKVKSKFISPLDAPKPTNYSDLEYYSLMWSLKEASYKWHEEFIELKNIVICNIEDNTADILLHSDFGSLNCKAYFILNENWALSVVEKSNT